LNLTGVIRIVRPLNGLISSSTVWISFLIAGGDYRSGDGILAAIAAFLFTGFANTVNDIADIKIDKINRPSRPLPSNSISIGAAYYESFFLGMMAIMISALLSPMNFLIGAVALAFMLIYSLRLKLTTLWGNLTVSIIAASAFLYGGAAQDSLNPTLLPALMAFLLHLGREITKDIEDKRGDQELGARTLPIRCGDRFSRLLTAFILSIFIIATIFPYILGYYHFGYLALVLIVDLISFYIIIKLLFAETLDARLLSQLLKISMPIGIGSVYLGSLGI